MPHGDGMKSVDDIITGILRREGGSKFTDDPADRGGPTKFGITLDSWREYTGNPWATTDDLKAVTETGARAFYQHRYITAPSFDMILDGYLRELVVDAGVHHGTRRAAKWLQYSVGVKQDGIVGNKTIWAVNREDPRELYLWIIAHRMRLFGRLVSRDPELRRAREAGFNLQARFMSGWANRVCDFIEALADRLEETDGYV